MVRKYEKAYAVSNAEELSFENLCQADLVVTYDGKILKNRYGFTRNDPVDLIANIEEICKEICKS
jgi:hypothetical protein